MVLYSPFVLVPKKDIVNNDLDDNDRSPDKILSKFRQVTKASGTEFITIGRLHRLMLQQLMKIYKTPNMNIRKSLDVHFEGEISADAGGPTKEYFFIHRYNPCSKLMNCISIPYS